MVLDTEQVRAYVEELLHGDKSLTEKEVKAEIARNFKLNPKDVGAGVIRDVRKAMGIDRPSALEHAKAMLARDPYVEAKTVVETIADKYGIRLGPPDVSRLRPKEAKASRSEKRTRPAAAAPAAAEAPKPRRRGRGRARAAAAAPAPAAAPKRRGRPKKESAPVAPAPAAPASKRPGRPGRPKSVQAAKPGRPAGSRSRDGEIAMTFEGKGNPADLATFFLSLNRKG